MLTFSVRAFGRPSRVAVICLLLISWFAWNSWAQGPAPEEVHTQPPSQSAVSATPTLSTNVDEVSFDLSALSKHNKPILDLEPSQLAITDDGSPVKPSSLRRVSGTSGSQHLVAFVFDQLNVSSVKTVRKMIENILGAIPEKGYSIAVFQVNGRLRLSSVLHPRSPCR